MGPKFQVILRGGPADGRIVEKDERAVCVVVPTRPVSRSRPIAAMPPPEVHYDRHMYRFASPTAVEGYYEGSE